MNDMLPLFALPDADTLYQALLARDHSYDGRAFVCVSSTGVFCRLTCPAPKPKRENCTFHDTAAACAEAGFRPCKRCRPLGDEPQVTDLLERLAADPGRRWSESDLEALGHDPSTIRRAFKRHFGMTFLDIARHRRLAQAADTLARDGAVIEAQLDAGFASPAAFRDGFARLLGKSPGSFSADPRIAAAPIETPLGVMMACCDATSLYLLEFLERKALPTELKRLDRDSRGALGLGRTAIHDKLEAQLGAYFAGDLPQFDLPLAPAGTPFSRGVWDLLRQIPAGETRSYKDIAIALGRPTATRAVAQANGANPIALIIPCHRVIGADGSLTGYGGGLWRKEKLLSLERHYATRLSSPHEGQHP